VYWGLVDKISPAFELRKGLMSLEMRGIFTPPDQQTSSFSNKKMEACQGRAIKRDPVTPDGNGRKWKGVTP
jgi:hypothetical protein